MRIIANTFKNTKLVIWTLAGVLVFVIVVYFVSVNQVVHYVAERQVLKSELDSISARIADLEFNTITLKNNITTDTAKDLGFKFTAKTQYVSRTSSVALVSSPQNTR